MEIRFAKIIRQNAAFYADREALHVNGRAYTYKEFYKSVASLVSLFQKCDPVGIVDNRDMLSSAAVVACLVSGKTYVPFHPHSPPKRARKMIRSCGLSFVFDSEGLFQEKDISTLVAEQAALGENVIMNNLPDPLPGNTAYILFTSGSTGYPKGVPVSYKNLQHFLNYFLNRKHFDFSKSDCFMQMYDLTFDVSVFCLLTPLLTGGSVIITPKNKPGYLGIAETLAAHKITVASMVPSVLNFLRPYFKELQLPSLRYSFFSGDTLRYEIVKEWSSVVPGAQVHNFYGPTETTIVCTHYPLDKTAKETPNGIVPIGKLFPGLRYRILDPENNATKGGATGELCISGEQVISSYLGNLHPEKFIALTTNGERKIFYRTGDLVSERNDGNLLFHGRADRQVKVNGYRIELEEIENCISAITNGRLNAVICVKKKGSDRLIAYVENGRDLSVLKSHLRKYLPEYMLPETIIGLEKIPLNTNGKVDYSGLMDLQLNPLITKK